MNDQVYEIPEGTTVIHENDLVRQTGKQIRIPSSIEKIEEGSFAHGKKPMHIQLDDNSFYVFKDHFLMEKSSWKLITYTGDSSVIHVPDAICSIGSWAFYECKADQVIFSSPVIEIHHDAFTTCRIREVIFPFWNAHVFFPQKDIRLRQYLLEGFGENGMFDFARYDEGIEAGYIEPERIREITARLKWPYQLNDETSCDYRHILEKNLDEVLIRLAEAGDMETMHCLCDLDIIDTENKETVLAVLHGMNSLEAYMNLSSYMNRIRKNSSYDFSI